MEKRLLEIGDIFTQENGNVFQIQRLSKSEKIGICTYESNGETFEVWFHRELCEKNGQLVAKILTSKKRNEYKGEAVLKIEKVKFYKWRKLIVHNE
jgi:hypothetical protein